MEEIKQDLKAIRTDLAELKREVGINTVSLVHHMRRSDLSEQRLGKIESWTLALLTAILLAMFGLLAKTLIG